MLYPPPRCPCRPRTIPVYSSHLVFFFQGCHISGSPVLSCLQGGFKGGPFLLKPSQGLLKRILFFCHEGCQLGGSFLALNLRRGRRGGSGNRVGLLARGRDFLSRRGRRGIRKSWCYREDRWWPAAASAVRQWWLCALQVLSACNQRCRRGRQSPTMCLLIGGGNTCTGLACMLSSRALALRLNDRNSARASFFSFACAWRSFSIWVDRSHGWRRDVHTETRREGVAA